MERLRAELGQLGISPGGELHRNLGAPQLYELAIKRGEGLISESGAFVVETGQHTGRSPGDKFVVRHPEYGDKIWWGPVNQPVEPPHFEELFGRVTDYLSAQETLFVQDCFVNADPRYRLAVRAVGQTAWHSLFARNMFMPASADELADYRPQFTVVHAPLFEAEPQRDGTKTGTFIALDFKKRVVVIGGTRYAGEMKKIVFTLLNYLLP